MKNFPRYQVVIFELRERRIRSAEAIIIETVQRLPAADAVIIEISRCLVAVDIVAAEGGQIVKRYGGLRSMDGIEHGAAHQFAYVEPCAGLQGDAALDPDVETPKRRMLAAHVLKN